MAGGEFIEKCIPSIRGLQESLTYSVKYLYFFFFAKKKYSNEREGEGEGEKQSSKL